MDYRLNNTKLVHWPLMGGLLHLVQRGGRAWAGCGPRRGRSRRSQDPLVGWGGGQPQPFPSPSTPSDSRYRHLWRLDCAERRVTPKSRKYNMRYFSQNR